ncbi:prostaglandin reductase 1-like [Nymphalis io]|uniref:prostaglandin reductase 1-like n=1 Tax=Inachis io TaxID=171585 RepID=UPI0021673E07|nr:prostaglandin reductase 1-like [Nymphalis io]
MVKARQYVVKKYFEGVPKRDDFEIEEYELPSLKNGEILVKTEWVGIEPYQRAYNRRFPIPFKQFSIQVGLVVDSKDPQFPIGSRVISHEGWCDYSVIKTDARDDKFDIQVSLLPDLKGLPPTFALGVVGMLGATAYFGLLEICQPKVGETIVVTGAAGAVGSLVGQIAKLKGCRVIGFAGSDEKTEWLEKELGFDVALNYKKVDIHKELRKAAPNGVDCYFDNVGGEISSIIMNHMNEFGRVCVCGSISVYNEDYTKLPKATVTQFDIVMKQIKVEGILVTRWKSRMSEAFTDIVQWIKSGDIKVREHVIEGFDNIYDAFLGMLAGENIGKTIVKV